MYSQEPIEQMNRIVFIFYLYPPYHTISGFQYNVSKSGVVTLTRCIGNKVNYHIGK